MTAQALVLTYLRAVADRYALALGLPTDAVLIERATILQLPTGRAFVHFRDPLNGRVLDAREFACFNDARRAVGLWQMGE